VEKEARVCGACTARGEAHYLTCVTLPEGWSFALENED